MGNEKVYQMDFSKVYRLLVDKAERKGRTREEVDEIIRWLTGYGQTELEGMLERPVPYGNFSGGGKRCLTIYALSCRIYLQLEFVLQV